MEGKLRENAAKAVKAILETAGFDTQEVEAPVDFSAMREGEVLLVLCSDDLSEIQEFDRTRFSLKVDDKELECRKLVFSLDEKVMTENCIVWGVKEFVRYAGEAALARILERTLSLSFAAAREEAPSSKEGQPQPETSSGITIPHLPIKVGKQAAEKIAGVSGNTTLRFMPHWFFHYVSSGEQVYKDHQVLFDGDGAGAINAINGLRIELDGSAVAEKEIPADSEVLKPKISKEDASEQVYKDLIDQLTKQVRIKQVKGDAIFYEEKIIRPEKKNIQLDMNQVYVPVWQVRGKKIVEINATTGDILAVPMDEGVEIL
jgi:hypothetical protein